MSIFETVEDKQFKESKTSVKWLHIEWETKWHMSGLTLSFCPKFCLFVSHFYQLFLSRLSLSWDKVIHCKYFCVCVCLIDTCNWKVYKFKFLKEWAKVSKLNGLDKRLMKYEKPLMIIKSQKKTFIPNYRARDQWQNG